MKAPLSIETARLLLRRPLHSDAQAIYRCYAGDPAVTRYLSWPTHNSVADAYAFLEWSDAEWERLPAGPYLIFARDGRFRKALGGVGLTFQDEETVYAGYALARSVWGRGFATEALGALVEAARQIRIQRLQAICHVEHTASARVLEKCGFESQGVLKKHIVFPNLAPHRRADVLSYAIQL